MSRVKCALTECPDCLLVHDEALPNCTTCKGSGWVWKEPRRTEVRKTGEAQL